MAQERTRFAHDVVYADGDFGAEEQAILLKLQEIHAKNVDFDALIGKVDLEFDIDALRIRDFSDDPNYKPKYQEQSTTILDGLKTRSTVSETNTEELQPEQKVSAEVQTNKLKSMLSNLGDE